MAPQNTPERREAPKFHEVIGRLKQIVQKFTTADNSEPSKIEAADAKDIELLMQYYAKLRPLVEQKTELTEFVPVWGQAKQEGKDIQFPEGLKEHRAVVVGYELCPSMQGFLESGYQKGVSEGLTSTEFVNLGGAALSPFVKFVEEAADYLGVDMDAVEDEESDTEPMIEPVAEPTPEPASIPTPDLIENVNEKRLERLGQSFETRVQGDQKMLNEFVAGVVAGKEKYADLYEKLNFKSPNDASEQLTYLLRVLHSRFSKIEDKLSEKNKDDLKELFEKVKIESVTQFELAGGADLPRWNHVIVVGEGADAKYYWDDDRMGFGGEEEPFYIFDKNDPVALDALELIEKDRADYKAHLDNMAERVARKENANKLERAADEMFRQPLAEKIANLTPEQILAKGREGVEGEISDEQAHREGRMKIARELFDELMGGARPNENMPEALAEYDNDLKIFAGAVRVKPAIRERIEMKISGMILNTISPGKGRYQIHSNESEGAISLNDFEIKYPKVVDGVNSVIDALLQEDQRNNPEARHNLIGDLIKAIQERGGDDPEMKTLYRRAMMFAPNTFIEADMAKVLAVLIHYQERDKQPKVWNLKETEGGWVEIEGSETIGPDAKAYLDVDLGNYQDVIAILEGNANKFPNHLQTAFGTSAFKNEMHSVLKTLCQNFRHFGQYDFADLHTFYSGHPEMGVDVNKLSMLYGIYKLLTQSGFKDWGALYKYLLYIEEGDGVDDSPKVPRVIFAEGPTMEGLDISVVDVEEKFKKIARRLAEERYERELNEINKDRKEATFFKKIGHFVKGYGRGIARQGYVDKYEAEYLEKLKEDPDFFKTAMSGAEAGDLASHEAEVNAILNRFNTGDVTPDEMIAELEGTMHMEQLDDLARQYLVGTVTDEDFKRRATRMINEIRREHIGDPEGDETLATDVAERMKDLRLKHVRGVANIDLDNFRLTLKIGKAMNVDVHSSAEDRTWADKAVSRIQKWGAKYPPLKWAMSPTAVSIGMYGVMNGLYNVGSSMAGRAAIGGALGLLVAPAAAPAIAAAAGGIIAGGLLAGKHRDRAVIMQEAQQNRREALGYYVQAPDGTWQKKLSEVTSEKESAVALLSSMENAIESNDYEAVVRMVAEIEIRNTMSFEERPERGGGRIDLISFSDAKHVERDRTALLAAARRGRDWLEQNAGDRNVDADLVGKLDTIREDLEAMITGKRKDFKWLKFKENAKAASIGALFGGVTSSAFFGVSKLGNMMFGPFGQDVSVNVGSVNAINQFAVDNGLDPSRIVYGNNGLLTQPSLDYLTAEGFDVGDPIGYGGCTEVDVYTGPIIDKTVMVDGRPVLIQMPSDAPDPGPVTQQWLIDNCSIVNNGILAGSYVADAESLITYLEGRGLIPVGHVSPDSYWYDSPGVFSSNAETYLRSQGITVATTGSGYTTVPTLTTVSTGSMTPSQWSGLGFVEEKLGDHWHNGTPDVSGEGVELVQEQRLWFGGTDGVDPSGNVVLSIKEMLKQGAGQPTQTVGGPGLDVAAAFNKGEIALYAAVKDGSGVVRHLPFTIDSSGEATFSSDVGKLLWGTSGAKPKFLGEYIMCAQRGPDNMLSSLAMIKGDGSLDKLVIPGSDDVVNPGDYIADWEDGQPQHLFNVPTEPADCPQASYLIEKEGTHDAFIAPPIVAYSPVALEKAQRDGERSQLPDVDRYGNILGPDGKPIDMEAAYELSEPTVGPTPWTEWDWGGVDLPKDDFGLDPIDGPGDGGEPVGPSGGIVDSEQGTDDSGAAEEAAEDDSATESGESVDGSEQMTDDSDVEASEEVSEINLEPTSGPADASEPVGPSRRAVDSGQRTVGSGAADEAEADDREQMTDDSEAAEASEEVSEFNLEPIDGPADASEPVGPSGGTVGSEQGTVDSGAVEEMAESREQGADAEQPSDLKVAPIGEIEDPAIESGLPYDDCQAIRMRFSKKFDGAMMVGHPTDREKNMIYMNLGPDQLDILDEELNDPDVVKVLYQIGIKDEFDFEQKQKLIRILKKAKNLEGLYLPNKEYYEDREAVERFLNPVVIVLGGSPPVDSEEDLFHEKKLAIKNRLSGKFQGAMIVDNEPGDYIAILGAYESQIDLLEEELNDPDVANVLGYISLDEEFTDLPRLKEVLKKAVNLQRIGFRKDGRWVEVFDVSDKLHEFLYGDSDDLDDEQDSTDPYIDDGGVPPVGPGPVGPELDDVEKPTEKDVESVDVVSVAKSLEGKFENIQEQAEGKAIDVWIGDEDQLAVLKEELKRPEVAEALNEVMLPAALIEKPEVVRDALRGAKNLRKITYPGKAKESLRGEEKVKEFLGEDTLLSEISDRGWKFEKEEEGDGIELTLDDYAIFTHSYSFRALIDENEELRRRLKSVKLSGEVFDFNITTIAHKLRYIPNLRRVIFEGSPEKNLEGRDQVVDWIDTTIERENIRIAEAEARAELERVTEDSGQRTVDSGAAVESVVSSQQGAETAAEDDRSQMTDDSEQVEETQSFDINSLAQQLGIDEGERKPLSEYPDVIASVKNTFENFGPVVEFYREFVGSPELAALEKRTMQAVLDSNELLKQADVSPEYREMWEDYNKGAYNALLRFDVLRKFATSENLEEMSFSESEALRLKHLLFEPKYNFGTGPEAIQRQMGNKMDMLLNHVVCPIVRSLQFVVEALPNEVPVLSGEVEARCGDLKVNDKDIHSEFSGGIRDLVNNVSMKLNGKYEHIPLYVADAFDYELRDEKVIGIRELRLPALPLEDVDTEYEARPLIVRVARPVFHLIDKEKTSPYPGRAEFIPLGKKIVPFGEVEEITDGSEQVADEAEHSEFDLEPISGSVSAENPAQVDPGPPPVLREFDGAPEFAEKPEEPVLETTEDVKQEPLLEELVPVQIGPVEAAVREHEALTGEPMELVDGEPDQDDSWVLNLSATALEMPERAGDEFTLPKNVRESLLPDDAGVLEACVVNVEVREALKAIIDSPFLIDYFTHIDKAVTLSKNIVAVESQKGLDPYVDWAVYGELLEQLTNGAEAAFEEMVQALSFIGFVIEHRNDPGHELMPLSGEAANALSVLLKGIREHSAAELNISRSGEFVGGGRYISPEKTEEVVNTFKRNLLRVFGYKIAPFMQIVREAMPNELPPLADKINRTVVEGDSYIETFTKMAAELGYEYRHVALYDTLEGDLPEQFEKGASDVEVEGISSPQGAEGAVFRVDYPLLLNGAGGHLFEEDSGRKIFAGYIPYSSSSSEGAKSAMSQSLGVGSAPPTHGGDTAIFDVSELQAQLGGADEVPSEPTIDPESISGESIVESTQPVSDIVSEPTVPLDVADAPDPVNLGTEDTPAEEEVAEQKAPNPEINRIGDPSTFDPKEAPEVYPEPEEKQDKEEVTDPGKTFEQQQEVVNGFGSVDTKVLEDKYGIPASIADSVEDIIEVAESQLGIVFRNKDQMQTFMTEYRARQKELFQSMTYVTEVYLGEELASEEEFVKEVLRTFTLLRRVVVENNGAFTSDIVRFGFKDEYHANDTVLEGYNLLPARPVPQIEMDDVIDTDWEVLEDTDPTGINSLQIEKQGPEVPDFHDLDIGATERTDMLEVNPSLASVGKTPEQIEDHGGFAISEREKTDPRIDKSAISLIEKVVGMKNIELLEDGTYRVTATDNMKWEMLSVYLTGFVETAAHVSEIDLSGVKDVGSLRNCSGLKKADLSDSPDLVDMTSLYNCPLLEELNVAGTQVPDGDIISLRDRWPNLKSVIASNGQAMAFEGKVPNLEVAEQEEVLTKVEADDLDLPEPEPEEVTEDDLELPEPVGTTRIEDLPPVKTPDLAPPPVASGTDEVPVEGVEPEHDHAELSMPDGATGWMENSTDEVPGE